MSRMRILDRIASSLSHRDFDLIGLLALSIGLVGVELWHRNWTTALFAGTLAAFALSMVRLRHDVAVMHQRRSGPASVFMKTTPTDVITSIRNATELLLIGVSLERTLRNAYPALEIFLNRRGKLRVVVVDPRSDWSVQIADRRAYHEQGIEQRRRHIETSIASFLELQRRTNGDVAIRVTRDPLTFGATMIDGTNHTGETRIVIQHYSYKKREATEPNPVFVLRPADEDWFSEFKEELENHWRDAIVWQR